MTQTAQSARVRLKEFRIPPLPEDEWSAEMREALAPYKRRGGEYRMTMSHSMSLVANHAKYGTYLLPFVWYVMQASALPTRDRELLLMRTSWLSGSEYEFGRHVKIAQSEFGLTDDQIDSITKGPTAPSWGVFDAALLRAADELTADSFVTNPTWAVLASRYSQEQLMEVPATVGTMHMMCKQFNSYGIQLEEGELKFPGVLLAPRLQPRKGGTVRADRPRIVPLPEADWSDELRHIVDSFAPKDSAFEKTFPDATGIVARHPSYAKKLLPFAWYILEASTLPARDRELLLLRTNWLSRSECVFRHRTQTDAVTSVLSKQDISRIETGPATPGWNQFDAALLQAAEELHTDACISDATWNLLATRYDKLQLMDVTTTVGLMHLMCMALNSYGPNV